MFDQVRCSTSVFVFVFLGNAAAENISTAKTSKEVYALNTLTSQSMNVCTSVLNPLSDSEAFISPLDLPAFENQQLHTCSS